MVYMNINNLQPGDIISEDLYTENGSMLLRRGSQLTSFAIEKLKSLGIPGLYINDEFSNGVVVEPLIPNSLKIKAISDLEKVNVSATITNASNIVSHIIEASKVKDIYLDYIEGRKDNDYLFQHSISVAEISVVIGKALKLDEQKLVDLATAALLHDIGKLFADQNLIRKIGLKLDKKYEDYSQETHPLFSFNLLARNSEVKPTIRHGVLFHHYNEDKTGYPKIDNLPKEIYIFAKIIRIADAYDNIRHADGKNNPALAVEHLKNGCDTLFNREIVESFLQYAPIFPIGTTVILSTGEKAVVYDHNKNFQERPKVFIASGPRKGMKIDLMDRNSFSTTIINSDLINENNKIR